MSRRAQSPAGRATSWRSSEPPEVDRRRRLAVPAALAALTVLAALLRFATLDRQSFWSDEAMTALLSRMGFTDMLKTIGDTESTPPLYYVLVWVWAKAFGDSEIGLRSLSALAGTVTVPVTFLAGTNLVGRRAGIAAAGLVAVSPLLVWYSQEARSYALAVLLCGISFAAFTFVLERPSGRWLSVWAVASVLAMMSHYFALFVVGAEVLWLLLVERRPAAARWAAALVTAVAAGVSVLALEQRGNRLVDVIAMSASLVERVQVLAKQLLVGAAPLPADRVVAGIAALLVVVSVVLVLTRGSRRERRAFAVASSVGGAAVVVPVVFAVAGLDYVNTRNAQVGMVPLAIAASTGLAVAAPRRLGVPSLAAVAGMLFAVALAITTDPAYERSNWRSFARSVTGGELPRVVVVTPDHQGWFARVPLQIYLPQARAIDEGIVPELAQFERVSRRDDDRASPQQVNVREVVLAAVGWDEPVLPQPLAESFTPVEERDAHGYRFVRFRSDRLVPISTAALVAPRAAVLLER